MINYSIIIPHYNIPDLLMRCLKSIPVREDVQVIVVDDCSPGAERYKELYPELSRPYLELYSTPIGGSAGRARNVGLEHAKGKWILFADADDYFNPCIDEVLDEYVNSDKDLVFFYADSKYSDTGAPAKRHLDYNRILDKYSKYSENRNIRYESFFPWGKIIRHSLIAEYNVSFQEIECSNDVFFVTKIGFYAHNLAVDYRVIYTITERTGSLSRIKDEHHTAIDLYARLSSYNFLKDNGIEYKRTVFGVCCGYSPRLHYHNALLRVALSNGISFWNFEFQFLYYFSYIYLKKNRIALRLKSIAKRVLGKKHLKI